MMLRSRPICGRLLDEHHAVHESGFLEGAIPAAFHPASTSSLAGQVVGSYRLISLIGEGGMGSVWLAERCDGRFEGRAAVKLLNIALWAGPWKAVPSRGPHSRPGDAPAHRSPH